MFVVYVCVWGMHYHKLDVKVGIAGGQDIVHQDGASCSEGRIDSFPCLKVYADHPLPVYFSIQDHLKWPEITSA